MKALFPIAAILFFGFPLATSAGPEWQRLSPPDPALFTVKMPGKPERQGDKSEWRAMDEKQRIYSVGCGLYAEPKITDPGAFIQKMAGVLAKNTGSRIAYLWDMHQQGAPSCEFKLVNTQNQVTTVMRYFLVEQKFFFLSYTTTIRDFDRARMEQFFDSFELLPLALKDLTKQRDKPTP